VIEESKPFFSEEKKQKTFIFQPVETLVSDPVGGRSAEIKVFWFFSSEKNNFLNLRGPGTIGPGLPR
jgi:hypothetical protein